MLGCFFMEMKNNNDNKEDICKVFLKKKDICKDI